MKDGDIMRKLFNFVIITLFSVFLTSCAQVTHKKEAAEVSEVTVNKVDFSKLDSLPLLKYIIEKEGLETLTELGVTCEDRSKYFLKKNENFNTYCSNKTSDRQQVFFLLKTIGYDKSEMINQIIKTWLSNNPFPNKGGALNCWPDEKNSYASYANTLAHCTLTSSNQVFHLSFIFFVPDRFDSKSHCIIVWNLRDSSENAKEKTDKITEALLYSLGFDNDFFSHRSFNSYLKK